LTLLDFHKIVRKTIILVVLLGNSFHIISQIPEDSINIQFTNIKTDTAKVNFLLDVYQNYEEVDFSGSKKYLNKALKLSEDFNYKKGHAFALQYLGYRYIQENYYDSALVIYQMSLDSFIQLNCFNQFPLLYNQLGIVNTKLANYQLAEEQLLLADSLAQKHEDFHLVCRIYKNIALVYKRKSSFTKAITYYKKCIELSQKINDTDCLSACYNQIGDLYVSHSEYDSAITYYKKDISLNIDNKNRLVLAQKYENLGKIYSKQGNYPKAKYNFKKCLEIRTNIGNKDLIASAYNNIGEVHELQDSLNKAIDYYRKSLVIYEVLRDKNKLALTHAVFGRIYYEIGEYSVSISSLIRSVETFKETKNENEIAKVYLAIGKNHKKLDNQKDALKYFNRSIKFGEKSNNKETIYQAYNELGKLYLELNQNNKAILYAEKVFQWGDMMGMKELVIESSEVLSLAYAALGNFRKAYQYQVAFKSENDSLISLHNSKNINTNIYYLKHDIELQSSIYERKISEAIHLEKIKKKRIIHIAFILGFLIILLFILIASRNQKKKRKGLKVLRKMKAEIIEQKEKISEQKDEIQMQKNLIDQKKQILDFKNNEVLNSIKYASHIQSALLPNEEILSNSFNDHFIYYKPRDIVSGDFYWFERVKGKIIVAVADCTGHGVSGALMSILGASFLKEISTSNGLSSTSEILNKLRDKIKFSLRQNEKRENIADGINMALCIIDTENNKIEYSGAYNSLLIVRNTNKLTDIIEFKGDRQPVAMHIEENTFTSKEFDLIENDTLYLFTDGYIDQFGGEEGKKFKLKNFKELLLEINEMPLAEQKQILDKKLTNWIDDDDQLDDILILGLKY
jgi:serine phosphatase RsbU (regulator of sigma subunit)